MIGIRQNWSRNKGGPPVLHDAHVVTVPGEGFGTRDHIRVSYATSEKELERGIERMRKFFGEL